MTTVQANAERIFADARLMRDAALERLAAGDIRDSAEKAWCATMRAAEALVLARTGQQPSTSSAASRRLTTLSTGDRSLRDLRHSYLERQEVLHGECFYHDYYDTEEVGLLVSQTLDYIMDAERLAWPPL